MDKYLYAQRTSSQYRKKKYLIWVLVPQIITTDENLAYYYDFDQSLEEYKIAFDHLQLNWKWQPVTIANYKILLKVLNRDRMA